MRVANVITIAKREYLARLRSKGFWISTIALPILMATWSVLPSLMVAKTKAGQNLAVIDQTGRVAERLETVLTEWAEPSGQHLGEPPVAFELEILRPDPDWQAQQEYLDQRILAGNLDAWVWINDDLLADNLVEYHAESVANFITQEVLESAISRVVRQLRLEEAGYDADVVARLTQSIELETIRLSEEGSRAEGGLGGFTIAFALFMILYMTTLIYGQQVMHGVLEEKSSRVVEVLLAAVEPVELLAGKLIGICLAGLTQLGIWFATAIALTAPGFLALFAFMPEGVSLPTLSPALMAHFFAFFLLGYFFYATFYAMIGSAFNNTQEAQQMASIGVIFVVMPWIFLLPVINSPDSTMAVVTSLIPLFTPFLMLLRIAVKTPPAWQIALGYVLTIALCAFMIWLCARVYRVGILMYGKKPTLKEIWRWVRYA
jgi:ABC-2 type transport system permease protein